MQVWVRMFGKESFEGELDYLISAHPNSSAANGPALSWVPAGDWADATLIQGNTVLRWGRSQKQFQALSGHREPDLSRLHAVLEPTLSSVPKASRYDPRSRDALIALWEAFDEELEPLRLRFSLGQRSFDLLSRMQNRFTSLAQYHLEHAHNTVATLQPAEGQLYVSPQAKPSTTSHALWRRRATSAKPAERFERLAMPMALGVYCQRTTRRLFSNRLRAANICLHTQATIRLSDHSDQVLAILVHLQAGHSQFADIAQQLQVSEQALGNALLGLYLSGIVQFELGSAVSSLFAPSPRTKQKKVHFLNH